MTKCILSAMCSMQVQAGSRQLAGKAYDKWYERGEIFSYSEAQGSEDCRGSICAMMSYAAQQCWQCQLGRWSAPPELQWRASCGTGKIRSCSVHFATAELC